MVQKLKVEIRWEERRLVLNLVGCLIAQCQWPLFFCFDFFFVVVGDCELN